MPVSFNRERAIPFLPVILRGGEAASRDPTTVENQDAVEGNTKKFAHGIPVYSSSATDRVQVPRTA